MPSEPRFPEGWRDGDVFGLGEADFQTAGFRGDAGHFTAPAVVLFGALQERVVDWRSVFGLKLRDCFVTETVSDRTVPVTVIVRNVKKTDSRDGDFPLSKPERRDHIAFGNLEGLGTLEEGSES